MCGMRDGLVGSRTQLINNVRGWLRGQGYRISTGKVTGFTARVREIEQRPEWVDSQLRAIDAISTEIKLADKRIELRADANPVCQRLMTVPGVGPQIALRFVAAVDKLGRFRDAHRIESYFGLVPGEKSSSEMQHRLSITKAGSAATRWLLVQAAWSVRVRCRSADARPLQRWALEIEQRRGRYIATVALARKLVGILYAIWRDKSVYNSARLSST
jgi:transposase